MSTLIVDVCIIDKILPHSNAEKLDLCICKGWQAIVKKGECKPGDVVINFPVDSVLEQSLSDRLGVTGYLHKQRVKAIRLRGEISNTLVIPINEFPEIKKYKVGDNVAEKLNVKKYEPPITMRSLMRSSSAYMLPEIPQFSKYTDIENYRNFPDVFQDSDNVVVCEKIHGCLQANTRIYLEDGTKKTIKEIVDNKLKVKLLGVDALGNVIPTDIINWYNNGIINDWYNLKFTKNKAARGSSFGASIVTGNHHYLDANTLIYKSVDDLKIGDEILYCRDDRTIPYIQEQIMIGMMLGDGSLCHNHISYNHKEEHSKYMDYINNSLGCLCADYKYSNLSGYGTKMLSAMTIDRYYIREYFDPWIVTGKKQVPINIKLSPISLAFWYMDDGSLNHHEDQEDRACFATCEFNSESVDNLILALKNLGLNGIKFKSSNYYRIRLNADEAEKLFIIISPYIPPVMRYKLPERYRNSEFCSLPSMVDKYKPTLTKQKIFSKTKIYSNKINKQRYDLETTTHNFIADGAVVHNSNDRVGLVRGKWEVGSHNTRKDVNPNFFVHWFKYLQKWIKWCINARGIVKFDFKIAKLDTVYDLPLRSENVKEMLQYISDIFKAESVVLYSEIFGDIQDLKYGRNQGEYDFIVFDIKVNSVYLDWIEMKMYCDLHNVPTVPVIATEKWELIKGRLNELATGDTLIMDRNEKSFKQIREGIVIKPVEECIDPKIGRKILKYISDDYLTRKGTKEEEPTEHH